MIHQAIIFFRLSIFYIALVAIPSMAMERNDSNDNIGAEISLLKTFIDKALASDDYSEDTYKTIKNLHRKIANSVAFSKNVKLPDYGDYVKKSGGLSCSKPIFCDCDESFYERSCGEFEDDSNCNPCCLCCCLPPCMIIQFGCGFFLPCGWAHNSYCVYEEPKVNIDEKTIKRNLEALQTLYQTDYFDRFKDKAKNVKEITT